MAVSFFERVNLMYLDKTMDLLQVTDKLSYKVSSTPLHGWESNSQHYK